VGTALGLAPAERSGALAVLKPGMPITLTEAAGRFEITTLSGVPGPLGHEVIAVGDEYVAVKDAAGVTETWIPIYSVACVKTINVPR